MKTTPQPANLDLLFLLRGANMNVLTSQGLNANSLSHTQGSSQPFSRFKITDIMLMWISGTASVTPVGGIYTGTGKTGSIVVAAAQTWGNFGTDKLVRPTLQPVCDTDIFTLPSATNALFLQLDTANGAAMTADIYVFGFPVY